MARSQKTGKNNRESYIYYSDDGAKITITPGKDGVTETDIQLLHALDDAEFNNNRRHEEKQLRFDTLNSSLCDDSSVDIAEPAATDIDPLQQIIEAEEVFRLQNALHSLEPQQVELIRKIFTEGYKIIDVAREQGVSHVAILDRLKRIYKKLAKKLE